MVQVRVLGVALDEAQQHVVLLKPVEGAADNRVLPVWIGEQEATSILLALQGGRAPRPLSHDLMVAMLRTLEAKVQRVEVTRIEEGTYYAELTLVTPHGVQMLDSRPSDAIALAARTDAPVFVADLVLEQAGVADMFSADEVPDAAPDPAAEEQKLAEFRRFLDDVDPEDFQG